MDRIIPIGELISAIFISVLINIYVKRIIKEHKIKRINEKLENKLKEKRGYFNYQRIDKYLMKNGQPFNMTPGIFIFVKLLLAAIAFIFAKAEVNVILSILIAIVNFFMLDLFIYISNKDDNEKMILDIAEIYDCLRIQSKGGVFIQESLQECYLIAKNKRLKKALEELNNQISLTKDIYGALENFNSKFNCIYIDTFVMTLQQSLETGKSAKALEDMSNALRETKAVIEARKVDKIERKIDILKISIFILLIAITVFGIFMEISREIIGF